MFWQSSSWQGRPYLTSNIDTREYAFRLTRHQLMKDMNLLCCILQRARKWMRVTSASWRHYDDPQLRHDSQTFDLASPASQGSMLCLLHRFYISSIEIIYTFLLRYRLDAHSGLFLCAAGTMHLSNINIRKALLLFLEKIDTGSSL